jgi:hypothetical protein
MCKLLKIWFISSYRSRPQSLSPIQDLFTNRVVHGWHFWTIFGSFSASFFGSFSGVWQKNDQNGPKNDVKNGAKNGYCERSETQTFQK